MDEKPIARCKANGVEAYDYPFYIKPKTEREPAYIFLEDHVYNFVREELEEIMPYLVRIENQRDLEALGFEKDKEGIYVLSETESPWLYGGKS
jgi:hypothetical protein